MSEFDDFVSNDWSSSINNDLPAPPYCRMTSQNSDDVISCTMDRNMSISLEELMENIKVPQNDMNGNERSELFEVCEDLQQFSIRQETDEDHFSRSTDNPMSNEGGSVLNLDLENHEQVNSEIDSDSNGNEDNEVVCISRSSNDSVSNDDQANDLEVIYNAEGDEEKFLYANEGHISRSSMSNEGHSSVMDNESDWNVERKSWSDDVDSECFSLTIIEEPFTRPDISSRSNDEKDSSTNNRLDSRSDERFCEESDLTFTEGQINMTTELEIVEPFQSSNWEDPIDDVEGEEVNSRSNEFFSTTKNDEPVFLEGAEDQDENLIIRENHSSVEENNSAMNSLSTFTTESILSESQCKDSNSKEGSELVENHSSEEENHLTMTLLSNSDDFNQVVSESYCNPVCLEIGENHSSIENSLDSLHEDPSSKEEKEQKEDPAITEQSSLETLYSDHSTVTTCDQSTTANLSSGDGSSSSVAAESEEPSDNAQSRSLMQDEQGKIPPGQEEHAEG